MIHGLTSEVKRQKKTNELNLFANVFKTKAEISIKTSKNQIDL